MKQYGVPAAAAFTLAACAGASTREAPTPAAAPNIPAAAGAVVRAVTAPLGHAFATCRQAPATEEILLDETRRRVEETVCGAALWLDGLFGGHSDPAAARRAHGHVELSGAHSEFEGAQLRLRFNAHVRFPGLEQRFSAFVGRDDDREFVRDRSEGRALRSDFPAQGTREDWMAGLRYILPELRGVTTDLRIGARDLQLPTVFVQGRITVTAYGGEHTRFSVRNTPFVDNRDGPGWTSSLDLDQVLADPFLLRWGTASTVLRDAPGVDWRSAVVLHQDLRRKRGIAYESFVRGATAAAEPLREYGLRTIYRHPWFDARLYTELVLGYSWPQVDPTVPREGSALAGLGIDLPYGL